MTVKELKLELEKYSDDVVIRIHQTDEYGYQSANELSDGQLIFDDLNKPQYQPSSDLPF